MKYWNKQKEKRENWTIITVHTHFERAKRWCQNHSSNGKFYRGHYSTTWYFQYAEDALAFKLIWDNKIR